MPSTDGFENPVGDAAVTRFRRQLAQQLRGDSVRASAAVGLSHPTSSVSAAELMAVLLDGHLKLDLSDSQEPGRDHLIFSKGRALPLYHAMLTAAGAFGAEQRASFRRFGSWPRGHSSQCTLPPDVATGSMGEGLPIGVGLALAGRCLNRLPYRVWVLCGDSEMIEDSTWEAFRSAGRAGLDNLSVIVDVNRLGQAGEIMLARDLRRARAVGWHAIAIDGHDVDAIDQAYQEAARNSGQPTVIFARTLMSRGVNRVGNQPVRPGRPVDPPERWTAGAGTERYLRVDVRRPVPVHRPHRFKVCARELPCWELGAEVATWQAYGEALAAFGCWRGDVVALDGEVCNGGCPGSFAREHPERYFQMFMTEPQMIAAAVGMQARGWLPFVSITSRAYDFARLALISRANLRMVGSQPDFAIGEDGASRIALRDFAALLAVRGSTVLHPSDANQVSQLVPQMADRTGISYMRTLRSKTVVRTHPGESIRIGGSRMVRGGAEDDVTVVACGATVSEAEEAASQLQRDGVRTRVIDCYSIKPIDADTLRSAARQTALIVVVEDHSAEGGLGEAVLRSLADQRCRRPVLRLAARTMAASGQPAELLHAAGIDAVGIVRAVRMHLETAADAANW